MVNTRSILGALALLAPFVAAAPEATVTKVKTVTEKVTSTVLTTSTKTETVKSTTVITQVYTYTVTELTTATVPMSTSSGSSRPASTVTVTGVCSSASSSSSSGVGSSSSSSSSRSSSSSSVSSVSSSSSSSAGTSITTTRTALQANPTMGLNDYAKLSGRYLGTAVDVPGTEQNDPVYMGVANNTHEFGSCTPANTMKYEYTEPSQGVFDFSGGDTFIALAHQAGINHIRCHNLVWYNQLPYWLTSGTWSNATLIAIMQNHITQLITHWGNNCTHWDVVNEALNDDGTWRQDIWYNTIGWNYVPIAFAAAQAAVKANNLTTKLYYNDYNIEAPGAKTTSAQQLVKNLTSMGIQIDGVGLQSHFIVNETWYYTTQASNMASFTALGVDVAVTELDARVQVMPPSTYDELSQFNSYKWTVQACYMTARCVGVTIWDFDDTYSWVPSTFPGQGYADVWILNTTSNQLVKKEAYDGIIDGFTGGNNY